MSCRVQMPGAPKLPRWACFRPSALPQRCPCLPRFLKQLDCIWACQLRRGAGSLRQLPGPWASRPPRLLPPMGGVTSRHLCRAGKPGTSFGVMAAPLGGGRVREKVEMPAKCPSPTSCPPWTASASGCIQGGSPSKESQPGCLNPGRVLAVGSHAWRGAEAVGRGVVGISFLGTWWRT